MFHGVFHISGAEQGSRDSLPPNVVSPAVEECCTSPQSQRPAGGSSRNPSVLISHQSPLLPPHPYPSRRPPVGPDLLTPLLPLPRLFPILSVSILLSSQLLVLSRLLRSEHAAAFVKDVFEKYWYFPLDCVTFDIIYIYMRLWLVTDAVMQRVGKCEGE